MIFTNEFINPEHGTIRVVRKDDNKRIILVRFDEWAGQNGKWYVHHNIEMKDQDAMMDMGLNLLEHSDVIKYVDSLKPRPGQWGKNNQ